MNEPLSIFAVSVRSFDPDRGSPSGGLYLHFTVAHGSLGFKRSMRVDSFSTETSRAVEATLQEMLNTLKPYVDMPGLLADMDRKFNDAVRQHSGGCNAPAPAPETKEPQ